MTRDELIARVARRLGNRTDLDAIILDELQAIQKSYETAWPDNDLPWFLQTTSTGLVTVAGTQSIDLPADFLREDEEGNLRVRESSSDVWSFPDKAGIGELRQAYANDDAGIPTAYAIFGTKFFFFPTPDKAYEVEMEYFASGAVLTTNIENVWLKNAPELMLAGTLGKMGLHVMKPEIVQLAIATESRQIQRVIAETITRQLANEDLTMGGS